MTRIVLTTERFQALDGANGSLEVASPDGEALGTLRRDAQSSCKANGPITLRPRRRSRAFLRDLPELWKTNPEQFVAYQGGKHLKVSKDDGVLCRECEAAGLEWGQFIHLRYRAPGRHGLRPPEGERRLLDMVAHVRLIQPIGEHFESLLHIEGESGAGAGDLRRRMPLYKGALRARHGLPVLSLAVYLNVGLEGIGSS